MRFRFHVVMSVVGFSLAVPPAYAQDRLEALRVQWRNRQFAEVLPQLIAFRRGPNGRTLEVDYMIGTSACRVPARRADGLNHLEWTLANYSLSSGDRDKVKRELRRCAASDPDPQVIGISAPVRVGVSGKTFYRPGADEPTATTLVTAQRTIPESEFAKRIYKTAPADISDRIRSLTGLSIRTLSTRRFIFATLSGHSDRVVRDIAEGLEQVLDFYLAAYDMPAPSHLITVYMVPSEDAMGRLAQRIHGIEVPPLSIGYTFHADSSLVGIIPREYYGTLKHELFHLLVRASFGDIPPWLDEGVASLYEESRFSAERLLGREGWRGPILSANWRSRPDIKSLVSMDWATFDASSLGGGQDSVKERRQAVNHATARYIALFLQEQGTLSAVYQAFRNRTPSTAGSDPGGDAVRVLESVLQRPIAQVDRDFAHWFCTSGGRRSCPP